ncbi:protein ANTAGONIST OF LIKE HETEROCHROMATIN PROTEIN 1-like [Solenopsis invicta]|uniref:protein ANTAGONIST OF LIKE HETEROCHROMATIN PROTEIN 1-like n=1 Tax=Solenopsis invicta TaxID=13686 RepID=UPI00193CD82B|nr:protein ANTAGONIST OF LIKE HETEROCHROMATIN PROTEIN 1-like [Solenopsis invicta]
MDKKLKMVTESITHLLQIYLKTSMMKYRKEKMRLTLIKLYSIYVALTEKKSKRSIWVKPIYSVQQRFRQGDSDNLIAMLRTTDHSLYFNYLRMDVNTFEYLLSIVGPGIKKQINIKEPIASYTRLQICLRYLASGDSMRSIGYAFRVSPNTVSQIIHETCDEIWLKLKDIVMPLSSKDAWIKIAEHFEEMWNFPHCIGAIDGKHIIIEAPPHSGSLYYNYKKHHSFNLTGVSDAHYRFILIDVGAEGRRSDAGVFANSKIKSRLDANTLNVPPPSLVGQYELPFVLVGDEAYQLSSYLMRPYPKSSQLNLRKRIFNYRLSRARRVVESAFGITAANFLKTN